MKVIRRLTKRLVPSRIREEKPDRMPQESFPTSRSLRLFTKITRPIRSAKSCPTGTLIHFTINRQGSTITNDARQAEHPESLIFRENRVHYIQETPALGMKCGKSKTSNRDYANSLVLIDFQWKLYRKVRAFRFGDAFIRFHRPNHIYKRHSLLSVQLSSSPYPVSTVR